MLDRKTYRKPPLIEVFASLTFNQNLPWDSLKLAEFYEGIGGQSDFPDRREPERFSRAQRSKTAIRAKAGPRSRRNMWQFLSVDGNTIVQVGRHALVISQLPPYYGWEKFRACAERAIHSYLSVWPADVVESAGLHYLDFVDIPGETIDLGDYFRVYPVLPKELTERPVTSLVMACEMRGELEGELLSVSFRQADAGAADRTLFRLQWDHLAVVPFPASADNMLRWLESAHAQTSRAFRASLTTKSEDLFQPE